MEPSGNFSKRFGGDFVEAVLAIFANEDQPVIAQHFEVLRHSGLGDSQRINQFPDTHFVRRTPGDTSRRALTE